MATATTRIVNAYFQGLRLPLTAIERASNRADAAAWPPAVAFEAFEAGAKKVLGSLLRDDELVREGRLIEAKLSELADAERLEAKADERRRAADAEFDRRQEAAGEARDRVEYQAEQAKRHVRQEKASGARDAEEEAARRRQAAAERAEARERGVMARERNAKRTRIAEESAALEERRRALAATKEAQNLEEQLAEKKEQRKGT